MKQLYYDSPLFSNEGITKAARDYVKGFVKHFDVMCADTNFNTNIDHDMPKNIYNTIDFNIERPIYIKNTRPEYWPYINYKFLGYHVLEGKWPYTQVQNINHSPNLLALAVPSENVKKYAILSGVKKPIEIIPHILEDKYLPSKTDKDDIKTSFLFSGAIYGITKKDRKGLDLVLKLWKENFMNNNSVELILKINTIYARNTYAQQGKEFNLIAYLEDILEDKLPKNISLIDKPLIEKDIIMLYNNVDCVLSPSRGEGFGLIPFEALGCGTPVIITDDTGMDQYLNDDIGGFLKITATESCPAEKRYPYYDEKSGLSMWMEPDYNSFVEKVNYFIKNKEKIVNSAEKHSEYLHSEFSEESITKKWIEFINKYY